jgi:hypothetical protein
VDCPHSETIRHLERDMWQGNGRPSMTVRMQQAEDKISGFEDLIPKMREFITYAAYREKQAKNAWWQQPIGIAAIVATVEFIAKFVEHHMGW